MAIVNRTVWFSKPDQLNDPFDSQLKIDHRVPSREKFELAVSRAFQEWGNEINQDIISKIPPGCFEGSSLTEEYINEIGDFKKHIESNLRNTSILSLSKVYDSTTMWSHYADSHKGICIEFDTKNIFPKNDINEITHKVNYKDPSEIHYNSFNIYADCCANRNFQKYIKILTNINTTKTNDWSYEKEWRLINGNTGNSFHGDKAIKSIFFGLKCGIDEKITIRHILHDVPMCFFQMVRSGYNLTIKAVPMDKTSKYWTQKLE